MPGKNRLANVPAAVSTPRPTTSAADLPAGDVVETDCHHTGWLRDQSSPHRLLDPPLDLTRQLSHGSALRLRDLLSTSPSDVLVAQVLRGMLAFWGMNIQLACSLDMKTRDGPTLGSSRELDQSETGTVSFRLITAPTVVADRLARDARGRWSHHLAGSVVEAIMHIALDTGGAGGMEHGSPFEPGASRSVDDALAESRRRVLTAEPGGSGASAWRWMQHTLSSSMNARVDRETCMPDRPGSRCAETQAHEREHNRVEALGHLLRFVPRPLRRLIESRACRGAIMFNDPLSQDQACTLVERLARTEFPFQCAHGRPSLIPLVRIMAPPSRPDPAPAPAPPPPAKHAIRSRASLASSGRPPPPQQQQQEERRSAELPFDWQAFADEEEAQPVAE